MSLTASDLQEIRSIVEEVVQRTVQPLQSEIQALRNDIKEIYDMIADLQRRTTDAKFDKLSLEQKILELNAKLISAAKQAGISLPR
jgi:peptidoglycan hydrolase CwlO-like protein